MRCRLQNVMLPKYFETLHPLIADQNTGQPTLQSPEHFSDRVRPRAGPVDVPSYIDRNLHGFAAEVTRDNG